MQFFRRHMPAKDNLSLRLPSKPAPASLFLIATLKMTP